MIRNNRIIRKVLSENIRNRLISNVYLQTKTSSYSQTGEDLIMLQLLKSKNVAFKNYQYLDIGSGHPVVGSNSYLFYRLGMNGILIDCNTKFQKITKIIRRRDVFHCMAVGKSNQEAEFYEFYEHNYSTFDKEKAHSLMDGGLKIKKVVKTKIRPIQEVIPHRNLDRILFVSIDVEGFEKQVIETFPFEICQPLIFCIEQLENPLHKISDIKAYMEPKGYELISYTGLSSIYQKRDSLQA